VKIYDALQARNQSHSEGSATRPRLSPGAVREVRLHPEELLRTYQMAAAMLPEGASPIIQLMSATSGEGTSTIARALSLAVAEATGRRVLLLLITATAKRPSEANDTLSLEAALRDDQSVRIPFSRPGAAPLFLASLSTESIVGKEGTTKLQGLWERLMTFVDVIIVDAPAALTEFAGLAMVGLAVGVILVIEAERTRSPVVSEAKRLIEAHGGKILGVVLNKRNRYIPRIIYRWL
jgi:protein-tyrosine kinase